MSLIYSTRVLQHTGLVSPATQSFVVPAGKVLVVKDVIAFWRVGSLAELSISIVGIAFIIDLVTQSAQKYVEWQGMQVVNAGETLSAAAVQGTVGVIATGYLLTA
jgi:hypothetical protein